jgi:hypothetical protein
MTWSLRAIVVNATLGSATVLVPWAVSQVASHVLPDSGWRVVLLLAYLLAVGGLVAWCRPRGFGGATAGVFLASYLPAQLFGGPTAKSINLFFGIAAGVVVAIGELVGLGLRLRAERPGHA